MDLKKYILDIHDYPKKGVIFKDVTPLLNDNKALKFSIDEMADFIKKSDIDVIVSPEARGFLFGPAVAYAAGCRFIPIRKLNKLPRETFEVEYDLEYGKDKLQIHKGDIKPGDKVAIIDDVLATGGTLNAIKELVEKSDAKINAMCFLIDLTFLHKVLNFKDVDIKTLIEY